MIGVERLFVLHTISHNGVMCIVYYVFSHHGNNAPEKEILCIWKLRNVNLLVSDSSSSMMSLENEVRGNEVLESAFEKNRRNINGDNAR